MTNNYEITCIICPIGCKILVRTDGKNVSLVEGEKCQRGKEYACSEALDPRRILTTSVLIKDGQWPLVSVKTTAPVPKKELFTVLKHIWKLQVCAPVKCGQVLSTNIAGTGIHVVATKTIEKL